MYLIIQTGDPEHLTKQLYGSFADWFIQGMGIKHSDALIVNVHLEQKLPDIQAMAEQCLGIVITGSPAMVTDHEPWVLQTQFWLERIAAYKIPTLGVCYGHQLLADMLGGKVAYNPKGRNMGLSQCELHPVASQDALFKHLPQHFNTFVSHLQNVVQLPQSATLLGTCDLDPNHAFKVDDYIWGVQFHPEWNQAIMQSYIKSRQQQLLQEGLNKELMLSALKPCKQAHGLLKHFTQLSQKLRGLTTKTQISAL